MTEHAHHHAHPLELESPHWMVTLAAPEIRSAKDWAGLRCCPIQPDGLWPTALSQEQLVQFPGWSLRFPAQGIAARGGAPLTLNAQATQASGLWRRYTFHNFEGVKMALEALTVLADLHDHHPEAQFAYAHLEVCWSTHSAGGISNNDWICAAHLDQALKHIG